MKRIIAAAFMILPLAAPLAVAPVLTVAIPTAAVAAPSAQLVAQVESGLRKYNLRADVARMDTHSVSSLFIILNSNDDYLKKRLKLKTAIANATYYR